MNEILTIVQLIASSAMVLSLCYLSIQIKQQSKIHNENHDWNRRIETQKALDAYSRLESVIALNKEFHFMGKKHAIECGDILESIDKSQEIRVDLSRLLNYYENLSNGVDLGIYDEEIIKSARRNVMIRTYTAFSNYIDYERGERNPLAYVKFKAIVDKWEKEGEKGIALKKLGSV